MPRVRTIPVLPKSGFLNEPGRYLAKVVRVDDSDPDYYEFTFEVIAGEHAGETIRMRNYLRKESLWALRRTLEALGFKVPDSAFRIDLDALVNRKCVIVCQLKKASPTSHNPDAVYNNVVGLEPASRWDGEMPKNESSTTGLINGAAPVQEEPDDEEEDDDDEVPDVLQGPIGA